MLPCVLKKCRELGKPGILSAIKDIPGMIFGVIIIT